MCVYEYNEIQLDTLTLNGKLKNIVCIWIKFWLDNRISLTYASFSRCTYSIQWLCLILA